MQAYEERPILLLAFDWYAIRCTLKRHVITLLYGLMLLLPPIRSASPLTCNTRWCQIPTYLQKGENLLLLYFWQQRDAIFFEIFEISSYRHNIVSRWQTQRYYNNAIFKQNEYLKNIGVSLFTIEERRFLNKGQRNSILLYISFHDNNSSNRPHNAITLLEHLIPEAFTRIGLRSSHAPLFSELDILGYCLKAWRD